MQEGYFPFPLCVADVVLPSVFCFSPSFKGILDGTRMWEIYVVKSIKLFCDSLMVYFEKGILCPSVYLLYREIFF